MSSWKYEEDGYQVVESCAWSPPGDHPVGCGVKLYVKNGELVKVIGNPAHPITNGRLCPRCLALKDYIYHPQRIIYPMKRDPKDRGKDAWTRISWDEAYDLIEEKVNYVKKIGALRQFSPLSELAAIYGIPFHLLRLALLDHQTSPTFIVVGLVMDHVVQLALIRLAQATPKSTTLLCSKKSASMTQRMS